MEGFREWTSVPAPTRLDRSAPSIGRDNAQILHAFAGYDEAQVRDLTEAGVLR